MSDSQQSQDLLSIGEASDRIDLPESTIRYYDREFSEYLTIPRGDNNERLFDDESLEDLKYVRYLIKRENLSIADVKERLENEVEYRRTDSMDTSESNGDGGSTTPTTTQRTDTSVERSDEESIKQLTRAIKELQNRIETIEENQQKILELLDLNLQRYNKLVEDL
ncbi:MAG: helix-turn-helix domain-containing protein [bacterium]